MSQKTHLIVLWVFASLTIIAIIIMGIWGGDTLKKYNQTTSDLTAAQDSITTLNEQLDNQIALKESDTNGLRSEIDMIRNQKTDLSHDYLEMESERDQYLSNYRNAITKASNLKNLLAKYRPDPEIVGPGYAEKVYQDSLDLDACQKDLSQCRSQCDELVSDLNSLYPWYHYYQCDHQRNIFKKLFRLGKCPKPDGEAP